MLPTPSANANHLDYCRDRSAPEGSSLYYASLFVTPAHRPAWLGVNTMIKDIQAVPLKVQDASLAAIKLAWWKTEMERAAQGQAGHPATLSMGQAAAEAIGVEPVARLVQAVSVSRQWPRHFTQAQWDESCRDWGGAAFLMAARALGLMEAAADEQVRQLGAASMRLTELLMLAPAISDGCHPFPVDRLQQAGISAEALRRREASAALARLIDDIGRQTVNEAEQAWKMLPKEARLTLRPLRALWRMRAAEFRLARHAGFPLLTERIRITPAKKFWLAWTSHALRR